MGANNQPVELLEIAGRVVEVDAEIADLVRVLNANGFETVASCSGHGKRPGNIALRDGREIIIARDWAEAREVERASAATEVARSGKSSADKALVGRSLTREQIHCAALTLMRQKAAGSTAVVQPQRPQWLWRWLVA